MRSIVAGCLVGGRHACCVLFSVSACALAVLVFSYFIICVIHISCRHVYGQRFENNMILIGLLICDHKLLYAYDAGNSAPFGRAPFPDSSALIPTREQGAKLLRNDSMLISTGI